MHGWLTVLNEKLIRYSLKCKPFHLLQPEIAHYHINLTDMEIHLGFRTYRKARKGPIFIPLPFITKIDVEPMQVFFLAKIIFENLWTIVLCLAAYVQVSKNWKVVSTLFSSVFLAGEIAMLHWRAFSTKFFYYRDYNMKMRLVTNGRIIVWPLTMWNCVVFWRCHILASHNIFPILQQQHVG